jgi:hypothetical protein
MGDVGFRISDAQIVAEAVVKELRKRLGHDAVAFEGTFRSAESMKRLLNAPEATTPQQAQLEWFQKCQANALWRVRPQFGISKGKQFVSVQCKKKETKDVVDEKRVEGKTFNDARDAFVAILPTWCTAMAPSTSTSTSSSGIVGPGDIPNERADAGPVGMHKQEPPKPWTPPPRRD